VQFYASPTLSVPAVTSIRSSLSFSGLSSSSDSSWRRSRTLRMLDRIDKRALVRTKVRCSLCALLNDDDHDIEAAAARHTSSEKLQPCTSSTHRDSASTALFNGDLCTILSLLLLLSFSLLLLFPSRFASSVKLLLLTVLVVASFLVDVAPSSAESLSILLFPALLLLPSSLLLPCLVVVDVIEESLLLLLLLFLDGTSNACKYLRV
jgi:hypothetical protein